MTRFDLYAPGNKPVSFTQFEKETIESAFPSGEAPIHFAFRTDIRVKKETHRNDICAVSPHFIACFKQKTYGEKPELYYKLHISKIQLMCYADDPFVFIKTEEDKLTVTGHQCLTFAQIVYRNYLISFPTKTQDEIFELRTSDISLFPLIKLPISLSQTFQFAYSSFAAEQEVPYRQEVVRYVHNMIVTKNPILDLSQLPADLFVDTGKKSAFDPVFDALHLTKIGPGICCVNQSRPKLLSSLADSVDKGLQFNIIHLDNCGIIDGMQQLKEAIFKKEDFPCLYWNLNNNKIKGWNYFCEILSKQKSPLKHLSLSNCGLTSKDLILLFNTLSQNNNLWELRDICLAGTTFDPKSMSAIREFIKVLSDNNTMKIVSLDLSHGQKINNFMQILASSPNGLRDLNISNCILDKNSQEALITIVDNSKTLKRLDISYSHVSPEFVARLIVSFSKNIDLKLIELNLSGLQLNGTKLIPVITALLNSDEEKFDSILFNEENMTSEDVKNLIPVLKDFVNLRYVSFSNNFNEKMVGVGNLLGDLLSLPNLKRIDISGSQEFSMKQELVPFLRKASKAGLEHLDITGQAIGDKDYSTIAQFVRQCTNLQTLKFDNNNVTSVELLLDLVAALNANKSVILAYFPTNDARAIVQKAKSNQKSNLAQRLGDIQISLMQYINEHRYKKKLGSVLPFESTPEISEIIQEITENYVKMLENYPELRTHSAVCKELNLPLPFQRIGDVVEDGGQIHQNSIGDLTVYMTESMKFTIQEEVTNYETFAFTTANPNFISVVEEHNPEPGRVSFVTKERDLKEEEEIKEEEPKEKVKRPKKKINYYEDDDSDDEEKLIKFEKRRYKEEVDSDDEKLPQFTKKRDYNDIDDEGKRKRLYGALPQPKKEKRRFDNENRKQRRPFDTINDNDDESEEEELPKKASKRKLKISDSDSEEEPPKPKQKSEESDKKKKNSKRKLQLSDSEEEEVKKPSKRKKPVVKDSESEDDEPKKPSKRKKPILSDSEDDDEIPQKKSSNSKKSNGFKPSEMPIIPIDIPEHESFADLAEESDDDKIVKPMKNKKSSSASNKKNFKWSDDSDSEEPVPKKKSKRNPELDDTPIPTQYLAHKKKGKK
ncbi:Leucine Rich Repeat family protein [Trichomonas vaginalis G3]|uniref:Leucine Rich Repeat family protein n=1 Tax=Trichomonas vaginalis (strain ATCC PRA-98 / G3) TaxID=412133 RepID=A2DJM6_TRIV3|nr:uncharacterized protein TVAGG3_1035580 [Trichomonas vaginalis G3]EAY19426.1 Leucine Rich Repeat family protein [Trichomonas vaginalis G3]KAI5493172.1 barbed-end actin filament uncapping [Trichomonas vaginalis G3]|eukprot:XP_001580412.1 hypothetical protein [Trichomonas vaginalis G3]